MGKLCCIETSLMGINTYYDKVNGKWKQVSSNEEPHFYAARTGNYELMKTLLENNWDPNDKNVNGLTPLEIAKDSGHNRIVSMIRNHLFVKKILLDEITIQ